MGQKAFVILFSFAALAANPLLAAPREKFAAKTESRIDARLYSQPNSYGKPISIVGRGLELRVLKYSSSRAWALIETPSQRRGWIPVRATTLGLRYSAQSLADRGGAKRAAGLAANGSKAVKGRRPASRGPASDVNLEDLGYNAADYEGDAQAIEDARDEAADAQADAQSDVQTEVADAQDEAAVATDDANADVATEYPSPQDVIPDDAVEESPVADPAASSGEYTDSAESPAIDTRALEQELGAAGFNAAPTGQQNDERKDLRGVRIQREGARGPRGPVAAAKPASDFSFTLGAEYANQINVGATSGFGFNLGANAALDESLSVGLGFFYDRFVEKVQDSAYLTTRTENVIRLGPVLSYTANDFGADLMLGWTHTSNARRTTNASTGALINSEFNGNFSENAFGLRVAPHFDFRAGETTAVRAYVAYAIDFIAADGEGNSGMPQTLSVGASFVLGL